jgi:hypothetical protein
LPNARGGIGESLFLQMNSLVQAKRIPGSTAEQGIMRKALGLRRKPTQKWSEG